MRGPRRRAVLSAQPESPEVMYRLRGAPKKSFFRGSNRRVLDVLCDGMTSASEISAALVTGHRWCFSPNTFRRV